MIGERMGGDDLSVSVVVNTLDRADSVAHLLDACTQLTHPNFEVIVVYGPCTDHTEQVLAEWAGRVKVRRCAEANLSMSRNIGIAAAVGDVVAFIDDDGIPEPTWLDELCGAYADLEVGAAGGVVYNHTGHQFQVRFMLSDRHGGTVEYDDLPPGDFSFPGTARFPSMLGCNSSFRRSALVAIGGFDEEFDYYLDETDVCLRLVDAGWVVRGLDHAPVHHKYLPSRIRTKTKVVTNNHSVVKNKIYFGLVNALGYRSWTDVMDANVHFAADRLTEMHRQRQMGNIDDDGLAQGVATVDSGWSAGLAAGLAGERRLLDATGLEDSPLLPFPAILAPDRMRLVLVTRTLPPDSPGGVGRYMLDLARGLAGRGHEIRLVTTGEGHDRVDLEHGVWVHRIRKHIDAAPPSHLPPIPDPLWQNAGAVAAEVLRINRERPVDLVLSSIWDVEWAGVLASTSLPIISAYTTPFSVVRATQPDAVGATPDMADAIEELERWAHGAAHAFQANGEHIVAAVADFSGVALDPARLFTVPLGSAVGAHPATRETAPHDGRRGFTALFFGRFERRKGIDLLLAAIPEALERSADLRFVIAGQDDLPDGSGSTFRAAFESAHGDLVASGRVEFLGPVGQAELAGLLRDADLAVLPSRFESFGLVFVEAMAAGLPVVALERSGAEEVVVDGETGRLCAAHPEALVAAMVGLVADPDAAQGMGEAGRMRYEQLFDLDAMAERFLAMFRRVKAVRPGSSGWPWGTEVAAALPDGNRGVLVGGRRSLTIPVPSDGRATLVLAGLDPAEAGVVAVTAGVEPSIVQVAGGEFHHVLLPTGAAEVMVEHRSGPGVAVAALIVASPEGHPVSD